MFIPLVNDGFDIAFQLPFFIEPRANCRNSVFYLKTVDFLKSETDC